MFKLRYQTPGKWTQTVLNQFDDFLLDHATAEKKASGMAMSMLSHYPDRTVLVNKMVEIAIEELAHFREVLKLIHQRGLKTGADSKDLYVNEFRSSFRKGSEVYLLDRLLVGGIIEARGHERFSLIADALDEGQEKKFYQNIAQSEFRHKNDFIIIAREYFSNETIEERLDELLDLEAEIISKLPFRAALH